jgi:hypothetical protein
LGLSFFQDILSSVPGIDEAMAFGELMKMVIYIYIFIYIKTNSLNILIKIILIFIIIIMDYNIFVLGSTNELFYYSI